MDRKQQQKQRYLKGQKKLRTREERQALERHVAAHKAARKARPKRRAGDWLAEADEAEATERIARAPRLQPSRSKPPAEVPAGDPRADPARAAGSGTVVSVARDRVLVRRGGEVQPAALCTDPDVQLAVGDEVQLEERPDESLRVADALPRRSFLSRPDPGNAHRERILAANVDRAVVVVALRQPVFRPRLIDRFLVALARGGVTPIVCANKADLVESDEERRAASERLEPYRAIGVRCLVTSATAGDGIAELQREVTGRTSVFVGQSGVGKSSLLNAAVPGLDLRTGDVRESDGKGRHTTTASQLFELADGTRVIDTPGVRGFGLFAVDRSSLRDYFPDLARVAGGCRFGDCSHRSEPDCAVRAGVGSGAVERVRYETYLRMYESLDDPG